MEVEVRAPGSRAPLNRFLAGHPDPAKCASLCPNGCRQATITSHDAILFEPCYESAFTKQTCTLIGGHS